MINAYRGLPEDIDSSPEVRDFKRVYPKLREAVAWHLQNRGTQSVPFPYRELEEQEECPSFTLEQGTERVCWNIRSQFATNRGYEGFVEDLRQNLEAIIGRDKFSAASDKINALILQCKFLFVYDRWVLIHGKHDIASRMQREITVVGYGMEPESAVPCTFNYPAIDLDSHGLFDRYVQYVDGHDLRTEATTFEKVKSKLRLGSVVTWAQAIKARVAHALFGAPIAKALSSPRREK